MPSWQNRTLTNTHTELSVLYMVFRLCMIDSFQKFNIEAFFKARNFSLYCIKCIMWKLECCSLLGADDLNFILRFIIFSLCLSECTHDASCARAPREARTGRETPWKCHRQWWHSKLFMLSGGKKKKKSHSDALYHLRHLCVDIWFSSAGVWIHTGYWDKLFGTLSSFISYPLWLQH